MLLILAHGSSQVLGEGVLPAAKRLGLPVCLLTDCLYEHLILAKISDCYKGCRLLECDVANPVAVLKALAIHQIPASGVVAIHAGLHSCALLVAEQKGLVQSRGWQAALNYESTCLLAEETNPAQAKKRWVLNAASVAAEEAVPAGAYPIIVRPMETSGVLRERLLKDSAELKQYLVDAGGYQLAETAIAGDVYALDLFYSEGGFQILCGSHFHPNAETGCGRMACSFIRRPPFCDQIIRQLADTKPGFGRYHVEYRVAAGELQIREINNGYYDGNAELAIAALLDGDLFCAQLQLSLGQELEPLTQRFFGEFEWLMDREWASDTPEFDVVLEDEYRAIYCPPKSAQPGWLFVCGPDQQQAQALFYATRTRLKHTSVVVRAAETKAEVLA